MSFRNIIFSAVVAATALFAIHANAAVVKYQTVFINNQFEDEVTNTASGVPNTGYGINRAPTITSSFNSSGATVEIPSSYNEPGILFHPNYVYNTTTASGRGSTVFAAGQAGHSSQSVGIYSHPYVYGSGSNRARQQVASPSPATPFDGTTSGSYIFSFDMSLPSTFTTVPTPDTSLWTIIPGISLQSNFGSAGPFGRPATDLFRVRFSEGDLVLDHQGGEQILVNNYATNQVYSISTLSNMDTDTFTVIVNGNQIGGVYNMLSPTDALLNQGIGGYFLTGGSAATAGGNPDTFTMYFDNIFLASEVSFVPEPGSGMLLGMGLLGLMIRRRRRQN